MNRQLMKRSAFILALLMFAAVTKAFAQDQIAVLQHEGVTTTYYGGNAFIDAYNAAENGDLITLSAGNFNTCDISKLITIHGAGVRQDTEVNDRTETVFLSNFAFRCGGNETEHLTIEGVYFPAQVATANLYYAEFYRCNIPHIVAPYYWEGHNPYGDMSNCKFINCRIGTIEYGSRHYGATDWESESHNVCLFNSIVYNTSGLSKTLDTEKNIIAYNSYIAYGGEDIQCSDFYNCVVVGSAEHVPQSTCTIYNSVMVKNGYEGSLLEYAFNRDCLEVDTVTMVFENFTGDFSDEQFILQDGITSSIQGTDGTEVCIYGGMYPFYDIPKYMIMRRCTVGSRTTDDGHLSVDIEVVTEQ